MTSAGYVITGWVLTGGVFVAYWLGIVVRTRRAEQSLVESDGFAPGGDRG